MRMSVDRRCVTRPLSVGFAGRIERAMPVLVVRVVFMLMLVLHFIMSVVVLMRFSQMQIHSRAHQHGRHEQGEGQRFVE